MNRKVKPPQPSGEPGLPRSFQMAWGLRSADRGPRPALTLATIAEAGVRVASAEGLDAVSMGRVASELHVATMSLYRYVGAKEELLRLMIDAAFADPPAPPGPRVSWRRAVAGWARAHLAVLRAHPWIVRVPISGPPVLPNQMVWFDRALSCFRDTPLTEPEKIAALMLVNGFVRNEALLAVEIGAARERRATGADTSAYEALLEQLIDPDQFPAVAAAMRAGVFRDDGDVDEQFDFGLDRVLDGLAALMARRSGRQPARGR